MRLTEKDSRKDREKNKKYRLK